MEQNETPRSDIDQKGAPPRQAGCGGRGDVGLQKCDGESYQSIKSRLPGEPRTWRELIEGMGHTSGSRNE
ncbi:unnamed protein product [Gemmata massiliana]|uniref:Uncharacterized protein n=1 Tax=Gemmata massiliana TaxID=1210884 RepID=A0A6P2CST5_9BACT|nr:unnamed protein product [Gemmata massiliana]